MEEERRRLQHWKTLLPDKKIRRQQPLNALTTLVNRHRDVFSQLPVDRTWRQRENLAFKLTMMFRRQAYQPVNVFVHLLLIALDVERIRAAVMQRCLFADYQEATK